MQTKTASVINCLVHYVQSRGSTGIVPLVLMLANGGDKWMA